jgi:nucleotide-binding universal stress UspA family protein
MKPIFKKILVPLDGSASSRRGLDEALLLAKQNNARIRLLHAVGIFIPTAALSGGLPAKDISRTLHKAGNALLDKAAALARKHHVTAESTLLDIGAGRAADAIVAQAKKWGADLIVIGTHGRRGFDRLALGSDAEKVVRNSPVPVLVVGPRKKRSP